MVPLVIGIRNLQAQRTCDTLSIAYRNAFTVHMVRVRVYVSVHEDMVQKFFCSHDILSARHVGGCAKGAMDSQRFANTFF